MGLLQYIVDRFVTIDRRRAPIIVSHGELGKYGEQVALAHLQRKGYRLLTHNYRTKGGEIDLICREGRTLCFVEVKTRHHNHGSSNETHPADAVHAAKQRRTVHAAQHYLTTRGNPRLAARFDVIEVLISAGQVPEIRLIPAAYTA